MSPPGVGGKYGSMEESLGLCSLLPNEGLENDPYKLKNNDMAMEQ